MKLELTPGDIAKFFTVSTPQEKAEFFHHVSMAMSTWDDIRLRREMTVIRDFLSGRTMAVQLLKDMTPGG
jgi:hypothetical protein